MIPDLDIYRATTLLVDRHGVDPATRPADRADELDVGNAEGAPRASAFAREL